MSHGLDEVVEAVPVNVQHQGNGAQGQGVPLTKPQEMLMKNPELQEMLQKMVERGVKNALEQHNQASTSRQNVPVTPKGYQQSGINCLPTIKSPSDTTIYAPALKMTPQRGVINSIALENQNSVNKQIDKFVEGVRVQVEQNTLNDIDLIDLGGNQARGHVQPVVQRLQEPIDNQARQAAPQDRAVDQLNEDLMDQAQQTVKDLVVRSEQQKIARDPAQGMFMTQDRYSDLVDVEFFHITCHVDPNLRMKIEAGQFVDLDKLLLKERPTSVSQNESRMGIYQRDGLTYFAPASDKDNKITNVRKWEQAFRVYAAIYSKANPHRSSEIWQYVYTINTAASSYHWNNVAEYDYTFRQLMGTYPQRSWAKTYLQGWNLSMRDPISKGQSSQNKNSNNPNNNCWAFNKGKCFDRNCQNGDHKCSYCGKWGHGLHNCRKRKRNQGGRSDGDEDRDRSHHNKQHHGKCDHGKPGGSSSPAPRSA